MAQEFTISLTLKAVKGDFTYNRTKTFQPDWTTARVSAAVQNIGTTQEAVNLNSDLTTAGIAYFLNLDSTNYVTLGTLDGSSNYIPFLKLLPGEMWMSRLATNTIRAQANTAAVELEFGVFNS